MTLTLYLLAGFLGLGLHWYNRFYQGRTQSTFVEYLLVYRSRTIAAIGSILAAEAALFQSSPDLSALTLLAAYLIGYNLDSMVNRDASQPSAETTDEPVETITPKQLAKRVARGEKFEPGGPVQDYITQHGMVEKKPIEDIIKAGQEE